MKRVAALLLPVVALAAALYVPAMQGQEPPATNSPDDPKWRRGLSTRQDLGLERPIVFAARDLVSSWPGERNADDIAGANNGTLRNGVKFERGKVGQAFSFDGVNDYVDVGDLSISEEFPFTILAWFKVKEGAELVQPGTIYGEGATDGGPVYQLWINLDRKIQVYTKNDCGAIRTPLESSTIVDDGQFHHVAAVHKSRDDHKLYIDGILVDTSDVDIGTRIVNESRIGNLRFRNDPGEEQFWKGLIDEVQIFRRPLSALEIESASVEGGSPSDAVAPREESGPLVDIRNEWITTSEFVVDAKRNQENPVTTRIRLEEGEVFLLEPNKRDRWGAHGPDGPVTDYRGLGRTDSLLTLFFCVGESTAPVAYGRPLAVTSAGELEMYCKDDQPWDNVGQVRVKLTRLKTQK